MALFVIFINFNGEMKVYYSLRQARSIRHPFLSLDSAMVFHSYKLHGCMIVYEWSSIGIYNTLHLYRNNHTKTTVNCLLGSREDIGYTSSINSLPSLFFTAWDSFRGHIAMLSGGDGLCNGQRQALSIKASDIHDQVFSGMWFFWCI